MIQHSRLSFRKINNFRYAVAFSTGAAGSTGSTELSYHGDVTVVSQGGAVYLNQLTTAPTSTDSLQISTGTSLDFYSSGYFKLLSTSTGAIPTVIYWG